MASRRQRACERVELVHEALPLPLALPDKLVEEAKATKVVAMDEGGEAEVRETESRGEGELDHHIVGTVAVGAQERLKWEVVGTKTPRRKRDQETTVCLASD